MNSRNTMVKSKLIVLSLLFVAFSVGRALFVHREEDAKSESSVVIGIDFGTTYSCVGVFRDGFVKIIANDQGNRITPSWVSFSDSEPLIGEAAKNQSFLDPERTIFDIKRLLGRKFDDPEVQRAMKTVPYKIVNKEGKPFVEVQTKGGDVKFFSPEEISAMVLGKMKETAEAFLGQKVEQAVVTVPAFFNFAQRQAMEEAGTIAGLNVVRITDEPMAAAIAYGLDEKGGTKNVLIFDLGGGTFDVSILNIEEGAFEILSTSGDSHLGGEDFNHRVVDYFIKLIKKKYNKDISNDNEALGKLRKECERARRALSSQHQVRVDIESLFDGIDSSDLLTRARFEELNMDLFKKTMEHVEKALKYAGLKKSEIDEIILVGGSTRIPKVQEILKEYFNGKEAIRGIRPDETVAYGAAVQGRIIAEPIAISHEEGRLSKDDIERLAQETVEKVKEENKKKRERIEAEYELGTYIYNMKCTICGKTGDMISSEDKEKIENALNAGLEWLENETSKRTEKEEFEEKMKGMEDVCNPIIQQASTTNNNPVILLLQ